MSRGKRRKPQGVSSAVPDAERTAESTPLRPVGSVPSISGSGGGGSSLTGDIMTEGAYLPPIPTTLVETQFGQRYVSRKPRALSQNDITARVQIWCFNVRGYHEYGTPVDVENALDPEVLLQDWYPEVRDMGKRSLKYKHIPTTLTDYNMLIYWMNVYHYVLANTTTLMNANRLMMFNQGLGVLTADLSPYMSRLNRLWRRLSAHAAPNFLKAHALRSGMIFFSPNKHAPVIRLWSPETLLASASGGPGLTVITANAGDILTANLSTLVTNLEVAERWLRLGGSAITTDFVAMKDLIDMTKDVVPGSFETGLPDARVLPGFVSDLTLTNEVFTRCIAWKDDQLTDQWGLFPIPEEAYFGDRVPVAGYGPYPQSVYECTLLGNAKFGAFDTVSARNVDVDTDFRWYGTDMPLGAENMILPASADPRRVFGGFAAGALADEVLYRDGATAEIEVYKAIDWDSAASVRGIMGLDGWWNKHIWRDVMPALRDAWPALSWNRFVEEAGYDYIFYAEAKDFGLNYVLFLAQQLGIPYFKGA